MRLIDADELLEHAYRDKLDSRELIAKMIENAPTVEERPTAEWLKSEIPNELYVCSNCGGACWSYDYERIIVKSRFCPNCGAKMKEVE